MRAMTGSRLAGLLSTIAVFLLPNLGIGVANALDVGETMDLYVPDLKEFPDPVELHQFTCVAVSEHAYWLVQDTCSIDYDATEGLLMWDNWINQEDIDSLVANFEGGEFDVYSTISSTMAAPVDTDGDPRIYMVYATIPDKTQDSNNPNRTVLTYVDPSDLADSTMNNHDIVYFNLHAYYQNAGALNLARQLRQFNMANGLAMLARQSINPATDYFLVRGLGQVGMYNCFGLLTTTTGNLGLRLHMTEFEKDPIRRLDGWDSNTVKFDYANNLGQEFLWLMYLRQRVGEEIIPELMQSDTTGMLAIARAVDPSVPDSVAIETNVIPLYTDWLITNLIAEFETEIGGGIYYYDFLVSEDYTFSHATNNFACNTEIGGYPFPLTTTDTERNDTSNDMQWLESYCWSTQYIVFNPGYESYPQVFINGEYNPGIGAGSLADATWSAALVSMNAADDAVAAIQYIPLNDLYNGNFSLTGGGTNFLVLATVNPKGTSELLSWNLSQDPIGANALLSPFQNLADPDMIHFFSLLADPESNAAEGFDWVGPIFSISHLDNLGVPDSVVTPLMTSLAEPLWTSVTSLWDEGNFEAAVTGYDSSGHEATVVRELAAGTIGANGLSLGLSNASFEVAAGAASPEQYVVLFQTDMLGLTGQGSVSVESVEPAMTGIFEGPVSLSDISAGTISFPADTREGAVYRWNDGSWTRLDSYWQSGRMYACVSDGGIYAYGDAPGVASPEIPSTFVLSGNAPNPFSSETMISFSLPSAGRASLRVYDMTGRLVRTIADEDMAASVHSLVWDGRDDSGDKVGVGVYFCRLEANGHDAVQKMLLIAE